ncbi:hypothetical protein SAMN05421770_101122 [Granulicella rosea]|uniref:PH domain-containing protein n=1 Tax=Granulicella rosea TaxID=474952 RepID=A0A239CWG4_9BACT|nr:hypothetical protein [Granulicella rosea]SNS23884.1 hypothetical protein SAMN05421770_101122 [Granulicella rosea]
MKTSRWFHWKTLAASAILAALAYAAWRQFNAATESYNLTHMRVYAVASVMLAMASAVSLGLPAIAASERQRRQRAAAIVDTASRSGDYTAKFPTSDRVMAIGLASFTALFTAFLWSRSFDDRLRWSITLLLTGLAWYAYRVSALRVRFTSNRITIHMYPFAPYVQRYSAITKLRVGPGNVHIRFEDGRTLNLWSGMGEGEVIVKILQRKVDIVPETR